MDKNFKEVKFGRGYGYRLTNQKMVDNVLNKLVKYYKIEVNRTNSKYFKFAEIDDYHRLRQQQHLAYFNIDKPHSFLYITTYNNTNYCLHIEPDNGKITSVKYRFADNLYCQDILFEGKIAGNYFLINDLVIQKNRTYTDDLKSKLRLMNDLIHNPEYHQDDPVLDNLKLIVQDFVPYQYLYSFCKDFWKTLPYKKYITGVVFRSINPGDAKNMIFSFKSGFHNKLNIPKVPFEKDQTKIINNINKNSTHRDVVCFKLKKTNKPDIYHLYLTDGKNDYYCDIADIPNMKVSHLVKSLFPPKYHFINVNCHWNPQFGRWQPFKRSFRKTPDSIYIFSSG